MGDTRSQSQSQLTGSDIFSAYTKFHSLPICTVFAISAVPVMPGGVRVSGFNEESSELQTKPSLQCLSCSSGRQSGNFQGVKPSQICLRKTCSDSIFQEQTNEDCDTLHSVPLSGTAKTLLFIHQKTVGCISILLLGNVIVKCLESLSWWKAGDKWKTSCPFLSNNCRFRVWQWLRSNPAFPLWEDFWERALIENFVRQLLISTRSFKKQSKCTERKLKGVSSMRRH